MLAQKWGRIIGVTTSLDTMFAKGNPTYGSSKAGHEALMASLAQELAGTGVTVNVLVPGGRSNANLIPRDTPFGRGAMIPARCAASAGRVAELGHVQQLPGTADDRLPLGRGAACGGPPGESNGAAGVAPAR